MSRAPLLFLCDAAVYRLATLLVCLLVSGCISSGPKTQYYTLLSDPAVVTNTEALGKTVSVGVGPVILPEYLDHPGIVSIGDSNQVKVSGSHAWAGELKENIGRVLANNLSAHFRLEQVWSFPWDNRVRPDFQLRLVFEEFSGVRGKEVQVVCRWTLLNQSGSSVIAAGLDRVQIQTASSTYPAYVGSLNLALNRLAKTIAGKTASDLNLPW